MRRLSLALVALAATPFLLSALASQEPAGHEAGHEDTPLARAMEDLNSGFKRLRRTVRRGQVEESLRLLQLMEQAAVTAKGELPPLVARLPEGERAAAGVAYRKQMCDLLRAFLDLEEAVLERRDDDVKALVDRIAALRDAGHERFSPEEGG